MLFVGHAVELGDEVYLVPIEGDLENAATLIPLKWVYEKLAASKADGESELLAKIAEMPARDRAIGKRLHAIIKASAPVLSPRTWYGMPAYYKDGKVVCHFQSAHKFKTRYATLGFTDAANLDEGAMWPVAFALPELTADTEARIGELVKKAVS